MEHNAHEEQISKTVEEREVRIPNSDQYATCIQNGRTKVEEIHGNETNVVAVHRNLCSGPTGEVRLESFRIFAEVVAKKMPRECQCEACLMEHTDQEEQISKTVEEREVRISDSEKYATCIQNGMTKVEEGDRIHKIIKTCMVKGMGIHGNETNIVAIHRNLYSGPAGQVRLESFRIFSEVMAKKSGGNANVKHAWYGASRDEIYEIIRHGFGRIYDEGSDSYGFGVYLSPLDSAADCVSSSVPDEHGLRHILLCKVILGKMEEVHAGSKQYEPSSSEFDSGVDNISAPRKHIIWGAHMNSHILPTYVISFKMPHVKGEGSNLITLLFGWIFGT
ncbi:hypothetical protein Vadar_019202 [Vaccinium darrowii]|uniref:Uncharacterized protein n=1 Tax=Vaccinium darrowii TaxID=229202 RepID=A0ACB7YX69_9ERIC|nr:hypothetical protein Vadar_019202 [Vaccinium darrowii]